MVRRKKRYLMPLGYAGLYRIEEEEESLIKLKPRDVILLILATSLIFILLHLII